MNKVIDSGRNIYLVGGCIRDSLMHGTAKKQDNNLPKDMDFCITGFTQASFEKLFPEAVIRGKDFPVYIMENCEFSLARRDRKIAEGHKGFKIVSSPGITIEEDLFRRDFTINSIAYDFKTSKIIDPFKGREDIKNKILRATSPAFIEDPLRVYRAARFSACLGFDIEQNTVNLMKQLKNDLKLLTEERVFDETRKALRARKPSKFFTLLRQVDLLEIHFPEINQLIGVPQPIKYHPEGDAFNHTMIVLDKTAEMTESEEIRFAALVHDIGKGVTEAEILPRHIGHEKKGADIVEKMADRLRLPNSWKSAGKMAALLHMKAGYFNQMGFSKRVEFLEKASKTRLGIIGIEIIARADGKDVNFSDLGARMLKEVNGKILGVQEGNQAGEVIHRARIEWIKSQMGRKE